MWTIDGVKEDSGYYGQSEEDATDYAALICWLESNSTRHIAYDAHSSQAIHNNIFNSHLMQA